MSISVVEKLTPEEKLAELLSILHKSIDDKQYTLSFNTRTRIKRLCAENGIPYPEEAEPKGRGGNRGGRPSTRSRSEIDKPLPILNEHSFDIDPPLAPPVPKNKFRELRVQVWKLIDIIEDMPPDQLANVAEDLKYIALGASTALGVAKIRNGKA